MLQTMTLPSISLPFIAATAASASAPADIVTNPKPLDRSGLPGSIITTASSTVPKEENICRKSGVLKEYGKLPT